VAAGVGDERAGLIGEGIADEVVVVAADLEDDGAKLVLSEAGADAKQEHVGSFDGHSAGALDGSAEAVFA
jgi:hypothetical protein